MKRQDFMTILDELGEEIKELFICKNKSYGVEDDLHHNFRETARRVLSGQKDIFKVLACYVDKHWVALCNRGLQDPEFESRCMDIIVYMVLAITMNRSTGKEQVTLYTSHDEKIMEW